MKTILIVEDDKFLSEIYSDFLKSEGYHVFTAENGLVALRILKGLPDNNLPDCILLDIMMPIMNGDDFLQEVQKVNFLSAIPIIVCSASGDFTHTPQVFAVLNKPVGLELMKEAVKRCLISR